MRALFSQMQSFVKIKPSQNGEITLSFTNIGKSCPSREFLMSQMCLLTLFTKTKLLRIFLSLQYTQWCSLFIIMRSKTVDPDQLASDEAS